MALIKVTKPGYQECYIGDVITPGSTIFNKKLFHNDTVQDNNLDTFVSNRGSFLIGGVLKLKNSVEYKNSTYEFIPINWHYPKFLVHSQIKNNCIKKKEEVTDYFVVIQFKEWTQKLPTGVIYRCIGPINTLENKYEVLFYYYPETPYISNKFK